MSILPVSLSLIAAAVGLSISLLAAHNADAQTCTAVKQGKGCVVIADNCGGRHAITKLVKDVCECQCAPATPPPSPRSPKK